MPPAAKIKPLPQHQSGGDWSGVGRVVAWTILLGLAFWPRLWIIGFWIFDHKGLGQAFPSWIVPVVGFFVLPWATLIYAWMWSIGSDGVHGWEWILVAGALLLDIVFWLAGRQSLR